ncbi:inosine/xanthosine triphosphatase [Mongoliibacter ruber]|uniref:Probable inosine/xanthosine triphosphatase n=1 Tax=Mongoliibacter ruber TaxID=1750599 RepID=A0A2T0WSL7_9BACT|nr:inosine/xanthosine triphosphatase [Mongoliibacter ruber]PRY89686.1 inosine/xanthosine triphosphatase [Mongoliibacter ruber]
MAFPKRKNIQQGTRQQLVIVGSKNPVKINCTESGFHQAMNTSVLVEGLNVDAGISKQPIGDEETLLGATNRAKNSKNVFPEADFWVGIEGGVDTFAGEMHAFAWIFIIDRQGRTGKAKTASFILPKAIANLVNDGMELGDADDKIFDRENSKQESGAVGILTKGAIDRKEYYQQAVVLALIPFVNETLYDNISDTL